MRAVPSVLSDPRRTLTAACSIVSACKRQAHPTWSRPSITKCSNERRQDPSVAVVDVLPSTSFAHSHIPGAINLPLAGIRDLAHKVLPDKSQQIIVYCATFT